MKLRNSIKLVLASLLILFYTTTKAQNNNCNCKAVFDLMIEKLETNYIAYSLTKDKIDKEYQSRKSAFGQIAGQTDAQNCTRLLQEFLSFFKDGHLFVTEYSKFSDADLAIEKTYIKENIFDINSAVSLPDNPIEGYWTDGSSKFLITKNKNTKVPFEYVAIVVHTQDVSKIGEIKFAVNKTGEGTYYTNSYASRYVKVTPYKDNNLLSIWGGFVWGRIESKEAQVFNPVAITFKKLDENKAILTIPSFLVEAKDLNNVLKENEKEITNIENLIIDIRGNTGGNGIYFGLISAYYERPVHHERGFALASDDNLAYFERFASDNKNDPYAPVVTAMKEAKGKTVSGPDFGTLELAAIKTNLKKVVILTDRACMSAAETFVLYSKAVSAKVVTMGDNTGGVVDYNNINIIKLNCEKYGISFGYPTYSRDDKVLTQGYNGSGIPPDVKIDNSITDKVAFIVKYLNEQ